MPHMNGLSGPELPLDEDIFDVFLWPCLIVNKCSWEKKGDVTYSWRSKYDRRDDSRDQKQEKEEERKCCNEFVLESCEQERCIDALNANW